MPELDPLFDPDDDPLFDITARVAREVLEDFVRSRRNAIMTVARSDGRPLLSPQRCALDASGRLVFSGHRAEMWVWLVRRHPEVSVLVLPGAADNSWVQVDGAAEVLDPPDALDPLVEFHRLNPMEALDRDDDRPAVILGDLSLIRVTITEWGLISVGGLGPNTS